MFIYCRDWRAGKITENCVLSFHSKTTICWCFLERVLTVWRYLNNYSVWGTAQLCYHTASVIIYSDCAWVEMEGLIHYTLTGNIYFPIGAEKLHERKLRKQITTSCACHLRMWLQLETDQQIDSFKKILSVYLVRKDNFILVSSSDKCKTHKAKLNKASTCCFLLFFNCMPWQHF